MINLSVLKDFTHCKIKELIEANCHESAKCIIEIALSSLPARIENDGAEILQVRSTLYEQLGDIYLLNQNMTQAIGYFRNALKTVLLLNREQETLRDSISSEIKYKISHACYMNKDFTTAVRELESILQPYRTTKINLLLAKLYLKIGSRRLAINTYKAVLSSSFLVTEAIDALIALDVSLDEITKCISSQDTDTVFHEGWFDSWIKLSYLRHAGDYSGVMKEYQKLKSYQSQLNSTEQQHLQVKSSYADNENNGNIKHISKKDRKYSLEFPTFNLFSKSNVASKEVNSPVTVSRVAPAIAPKQLIASSFTVNSNVLVLHIIACASMEAGRHDDTTILFNSIRRLDPYYISSLDYYAELLHNRGESTELSKLGHELIHIDDRSPVGWLALAYLCSLRKDAEKMIVFLDKAIKSDNLYANAYRVKGMLLHMHGVLDKALICYYQANNINRDILSFVGVLEANIALGNVKQACKCGQDALAMYPNSVLVLLAVGQAYCKQEGREEEGMKLIRRAAIQNPSHKRAVALYAQALVDNEMYQEAIPVILSGINFINTAHIHYLLGKCYLQTGHFGDASNSLHFALSLLENSSSSSSSARANSAAASSTCGGSSVGIAASDVTSELERLDAAIKETATPHGHFQGRDDDNDTSDYMRKQNLSQNLSYQFDDTIEECGDDADNDDGMMEGVEGDFYEDDPVDDERN